MRKSNHVRQWRRRRRGTRAILLVTAIGLCVSLSGLDPVRAAQRGVLEDQRAPQSLTFDEVGRGIGERLRALREQHHEHLRRGSLPQTYQPPLPAKISGDADSDLQTDPLGGVQ